jgi:hypothetical protein
MGITCFPEPGMTEDLQIVQKENFYEYHKQCVGYVHLTKTKPIHKRQIHLSSWRRLRKDYDSKSSAEKISGRESQKAWRQD